MDIATTALCKRGLGLVRPRNEGAARLLTRWPHPRHLLARGSPIVSYCWLRHAARRLRPGVCLGLKVRGGAQPRMSCGRSWRRKTKNCCSRAQNGRQSPTLLISNAISLRRLLHAQRLQGARNRAYPAPATNLRWVTLSCDPRRPNARGYAPQQAFCCQHATALLVGQRSPPGNSAAPNTKCNTRLIPPIAAFDEA
jgi:hypothetical protein